ncbi:4-diphosphocytidyl-2-C-methyl-D-erythritol kinase [Glycocaulis albus]|uniref:4-diphosphocytidyl-2-C-methyl-D-erythritol kinase n=1 Tax=Glycocaulis albus TaxID=1382801 RepID=A0ABQ1XRC4_9PROT|nr:4-(cytidine 5'-diphospho)-2-C-methyl-D-erythritol kinase [Glycocaulis albus]GGH00821.1 4-diphosphocytidyl-2-C-methyl-D-erythritol kinase [Glycocaulis albus]
MSESGPGRLTVFAPAKINLTLRVAVPRPDGYHPLQSLVVFADWGDTLHASPASDLSLQLEGPFAPTLADDTHNLVLKAAWALRAAADQPQLGARLVLDKHLPVASGMGGGSADAAAALKVLNDLWELDFSTRELAEIGSVVGADVPACVWSRPLLMEGIGEGIRVLPAWPELNAVIVNPGVPVSTPDVFRALDRCEDRTGFGVLSRVPVAGDPAAALALAAAGRNDLEQPAVILHPVIGDVLAELNVFDAVRLARMSGSGASCFALVDEAAMASHVARALSESHPDWIVRPVRLAGAA